MSLLGKLDTILEDGKKQWENCKAFVDFTRDEYGDDQNLIVQSDNLSFCRYMMDQEAQDKIKLIYADPPFFSKADYKNEIKLKTHDGQTIPLIKQKAYKDSWEHGMEEYLTMLAARLYAFKEVLSDDGSIWMHLDWHAVHYVKVLMDEIFGADNFVNEVVWNYKSGGSTKRRYSRKHDTLLFYSKTKDYYFKPQKEKSYNRGFKPYRFKGVKEYKDENGWYTLVNMKDVWQIDMVGRTSAERTGYATQKPEALLFRIIESCTEEGDICADFFGGSGTMAASADKMDRRWISCDNGRLSTINTLKRMLKNGSRFQLWTEETSGDGIDAEVFIENIPAADKKHIKVELTGYHFPEDADIPVDEKHIDLIKEVEDKDWLQLIDYYAVDFDYDGEMFVPHVHAAKEGEYISSSVEKIISESSQIAVKAVDIFGNVSMIII